MSVLSISAPAKLNLFLHVTGKRADGYHSLESLVAFTEFGDGIEIEEAEDLTLDIVGPFAAALSSEKDNLILKAARLLQARAAVTRGARMRLHKRIPIGAGLGGGSADAAAAMRGLKDLWKLSLAEAELLDIAAEIGSDVPVCLASRSAWMSGRGEQVAPANIPSLYVLLVNPGASLLTADVFRRFSENFDASIEMPKTMDLHALIAFLKAQRNSLQNAAISIMPAVDDVLAAISATQGCALSRMAGSGSTCFGLYESQGEARVAAERMKQDHPAWFIMATRTL